MSKADIHTISAAEASPLRHDILRPGQPAERLVYPGDDSPTSAHVGIRVGGALVSVASFYREPVPESRTTDVRIRGMATVPEHRGKGYGRRLVEHGLALNQWHGCESAWCNARISAAEYYSKLGFQHWGELFELPDIGPHVVMVRPLHAHSTKDDT